jgi:hypothetical protein
MKIRNPATRGRGQQEPAGSDRNRSPRLPIEVRDQRLPIIIRTARETADAAELGAWGLVVDTSGRRGTSATRHLEAERAGAGEGRETEPDLVRVPDLVPA